MLRRLSLTLLLCPGFCFGQPVSAALPQKLAAGKILERVVCSKFPEQSYALYVPSAYSGDHSWPVVFAFDPGARGKIPVELMKEAAEKYGYIVLGSNNSRNGAWKPELDAAEAMLQDAQERFSVDLKRVYFAGFSGGARVASQLAQLCKCAAGVLLSGAGFSQNSSPLRETPFPVFSAVGNLDFNYSELIPLQDKLEQAEYPHWLGIFDGIHEWAPAEVMNEAFAWFRVQAMRSKREARNDDFVAAELKEMVSIAEKRSGSGDLLSAWRQYKQIASTYDGIADVAQFKGKAEELSRTKAVQDALKRERSDFEQQASLSNDILESVQAQNGVEYTQRDIRASERIDDLRHLAESEKHPDRAIVLKRAVAGIFVGAIESGNHELERKDYRAAANYFLAAAKARPDAEWPLRQLAIAEALGKNRNRAVETLKRIKAITGDSAEFASWFQTEPAFQEIRKSVDLRDLGTKH
jgi:predicted esterase